MYSLFTFYLLFLSFLLFWCFRSSCSSSFLQRKEAKPTMNTVSYYVWLVSHEDLLIPSKESFHSLSWVFRVQSVPFVLLVSTTERMLSMEALPLDDSFIDCNQWIGRLESFIVVMSGERRHSLPKTLSLLIPRPSIICIIIACEFYFSLTCFFFFFSLQVLKHKRELFFFSFLG